MSASRTGIQTFRGFRGTCAMAQIGNIQFCLMAKNPKQLQTLWDSMLQEAGPLAPEMCHRAVLVEASLLPPEQTTTKGKPPTVV